MASPFVNMFPYALGIAVSPVPVMTVILMLFSQQPRLNGLSFLLGWALGIAIPATGVLLLAISGDASNDGPPSIEVSVFRILAGIALLVIAARNWMLRHKPDESTAKNVLTRMLDAIAPWKALFLGFLFADVTNPKNMALTIAGCMEISAARPSIPETYILVITFVLIASAGVALPVVFYMLGGDASRRNIETWRKWLLVNRRTVLSLLFFILGISVTLRGVAEVMR